MSVATRNKFELSRLMGDDDCQINKKLPRELILRILSYLDVVSLCRCAQVSKLWNVLALDGSNWQRIDLFDFQTDVEGPVIENISKRSGGFMRQLSLRGCEGIADGSMRTLALLCPNLEVLNLSKCKKLTDLSCQSIAKHCPKLQRINYESCSYITDISLKALSDGCPLLTHINVSWCNSITENGVEALARGCPRLKSFISKGCKQVNDKAVTCLAKYCPNLEVINVQGCDSLTDEAVAQLGTYCTGLRQICLSGCVLLTDSSLTVLAQRCTGLTTLEVAQCSHFTDTGFQALARILKAIHRWRDMFTGTVPSEPNSLWKGKVINHLSIQQHVACIAMTLRRSIPVIMSPSMGAVINEKKVVTNCRLLERMDLEECSLITDTTLVHLSTGCPRLEKLTLSHCELITDLGIRHLSTSSCAAEHLTVLGLDNCPLITDAALDHLTSCHNLQVIELYDCQLVTRNAIRKLRNHLPNIKVHAYFAPVTPPPAAGAGRQRYCRCCNII